MTILSHAHLEALFHKYVIDSPKMPEDGETIYWRDCASADAGYIWVFEDGTSMRRQHPPAVVFGPGRG